MKSALRKVLIILIGFVFVFELLLPANGINLNTAKAESLSNSDLAFINGKTNLLEGKYYSFNNVQSALYRNFDKLEIYADSSDAANGRAAVTSGSTVEIYDGAEINIKLRNSNSKNYKTILLARKPEGNYIEEAIIDDIKPIKLDYERLAFLRSMYGDSTEFYISVKKEGGILGLFDSQVHDNLIRIAVKPNRVIFANNCANVNQSGTECLNGAFETGYDYENRTLLLRAGQPVTLTSKDKGNANEYLTTTFGGVDISGNTVTAQNVPGFRLQMYYHCGGSVTRVPVIVSNMSQGTCQITYGKCENVAKKVQGYHISKSIGVKYNTNTTIKAVLDGAYNNCATTPKMSIQDMSSCLKTTPKITYNNETISIVLNAKKDGILKVSIDDRLGVTKNEYWYIYKCDNTQVTNPIVPKAKQNTNINENTTSNEDAGSVVCIPDIPVNFTWYIDNTGNLVTYDLYAENSTHTYYDFVKRANTNIPNSIYRNYNWKYGDGDAGHMKISAEKTAYEDGVYDLIVRGENETGQYTTILDTIWMGPSHSLKTPHIMAQDSGIVDDKTGSVTYHFKTEYCSEVKYKVIKRSNPDVSYDESILDTYDGFDGIVTDNPDEFEVKISPAVSGAGYYDIVLYGINKSLYNESYIYSPIDIKGVLVNNAPQVTISKVGDASLKSHQEFKLETFSVDKDNISSSYVLVNKKESVSDVSLPSIDDIKQNGESFTSGKVVALDKQANGAGYYDIIVYAEDEFGTGRMEFVQNIMLAEDPRIEYSVDGEKDDVTCSISNRYVQNVKVKVIDDLVDKYDLEYCYTKDDITNDGKDEIDFNKFYNNSNYKVTKISNVSSGNNVSITLNATNNIDENVYLYVLAKPQGNTNQNAQVLRTGSIRLDGTDLKLESIKADKDPVDGKKVGYNNSKPLEITLAFNHEIDENIGADLYINIGNTAVKQDSIRVEGNKAIYSYNLPDNCEHGDISINRIEYTKAFAGKGNNSKTYNKNISTDSEIIDLVSGNYFADTVRPEALSYTVEVEAEEENILRDRIKGIVYVQNFKTAKIVAKYNEDITGYPTPIFIVKGRKTCGYVYGVDEDDTIPRDTDIYDLASILSYKGFEKYEGDIRFDDFFEAMGSTYDLAGNEVILPDNVEFTFKVNGEEINNNRIVVFDSRVYEPEVTVNEEKIDDDATYIPNTEIKLFAEYEDQEKYPDLAEINYLELQVNYDSEVTVIDCNDNVIPANYLVEGDNGYDEQERYILDESQLPVHICPSENGDYKVKLIKKDRLNNSTSVEKKFSIYGNISIDKEESKFVNIDNNTKMSISGKTEAQRTYNVAIKLEDRDTNSIKVYRYNEKTRQEEELTLAQEKDPNTKIAKYKFVVDRAGENKIIIRDLEGNILLVDYIETYNLFIIGDTNFDGNIDATDATDILRYIVRLKGYNTENIAFAGDVNNDGDADVSDVIKLMRYVVMDPDIYMDSDGYLRNGGN